MDFYSPSSDEGPRGARRGWVGPRGCGCFVRVEVGAAKKEFKSTFTFTRAKNLCCDEVSAKTVENFLLVFEEMLDSLSLK